MVRETRRQARDLLGEARGQVQEQARTGQQRAAGGLRAIAEELRPGGWHAAAPAHSSWGPRSPACWPVGSPAASWLHSPTMAAAPVAGRWLLDQGIEAGHTATAGDSAGGNLADVTVEISPVQQHVYPFMAGRALEADTTIANLGAWLRPKLGMR